jgi:predicted flavoprotein YhiN
MGEAGVDDGLRSLGSRPVLGFLRERFPERLARVLLRLAQVPDARSGATLTRAERRSLVRGIKALSLPITGDRGFRYAEVTAGGVPLSELRLPTLESRPTPGLYLCGEICDVDGRIGGFNFQWAWASGTVAGRAAALGLESSP